MAFFKVSTCNLSICLFLVCYVSGKWMENHSSRAWRVMFVSDYSFCLGKRSPIPRPWPTTRPWAVGNCMHTQSICLMLACCLWNGAACVHHACLPFAQKHPLPTHPRQSAKMERLGNSGVGHSDDTLTIVPFVLFEELFESRDSSVNCWTKSIVLKGLLSQFYFFSNRT